MSKIIYVLSCSTEDPPKAAAGLLHIAAAASAKREIAVWLWHEGVRMAVEGVAETFREPLEPSPVDVLKQLAEANVPILVHRPCFTLREFEESALRTGCSLADGDKLAHFVGDGFVPVALS